MTWRAAGYQAFGPDRGVLEWLDHAGPVALACACDAAMRTAWLRHGETWFAGVNVLENDAEGRVAGSPPLRCASLKAAEAVSGRLPLDTGQVSVTYPGYPRQDAGESDAQVRYRRRRDAAHVDGLLPVGPERCRMLREPHAWILGLPVTECGAGAAPLVVWEGSHEVMRARLGAVLRDQPQEAWPDVDLTEAYHQARAEAFETCPRIELPARPGEALLLHRAVLHGVAPWQEGATAPPEGRAIIYFRPQLPGGAVDWLRLP
ncbi:MAG: hypothetical protein COW55_15130 [Rhodobacteraceae bacterium CG17_big_fil_post_rev_8_21_14_2_50_65_11]|nr:MAG: hypothetical protein COW55_15130 [Rhodobacteraceae bacterium CG17_big_fil_post_rev_8_21_14_2_50_65_11]